MEKNLIQTRQDFVTILEVRDANPSGDPLCENLPRMNYDGLGIIMAVCGKRKMRNRVYYDKNGNILIQSNDKAEDGFNNIKDRFENVIQTNNNIPDVFALDKKEIIQLSNKTFFDSRMFGAVLPFKGGDKSAKGKKDKKSKEEVVNTEKIDQDQTVEQSDAVSIGILGALTLMPIKSILPINRINDQITKSTNTEPNKDKSDKKASDTMGRMPRVPHALYVMRGSINARTGMKNGVTLNDVEAIKSALTKLFVNDDSSQRPAGSMQVLKTYWWDHNEIDGQCSVWKVYDSLTVTAKPDVYDSTSINDYEITLKEIPGLVPQIIEGW